MPVDRVIYKVPFHKGNQPQWVCPTCKKGILKGKKNSFIKDETVFSRIARQLPDWDPEWIQYAYSCQFECTNSSCEEVVFSMGIGTVDVDYGYDDGGDPEMITTERFEPRFFIPHLKIFSVPQKTPDDIQMSIDDSFELFFANPSSSAGHLRIALEKLLDHLKIKKSTINKGKRRLLSLHKRIGLLPTKFDDLKDLFYAIKWLGNDGSHPAGVTKDDVMDAYDIFETILDEIFSNQKKETKKLAKKINRKRK